MIEYYSATHLVIYGLPKAHDAISFEKYKDISKDSLSCIFDEVKAKLFQNYPGELAHMGSNFITGYKMIDGTVCNNTKFEC
jgi:hypothetical protein